jgi:hypothetical protein
MYKEWACIMYKEWAWFRIQVVEVAGTRGRGPRKVCVMSCLAPWDLGTLGPWDLTPCTFVPCLVYGMACHALHLACRVSVYFMCTVCHGIAPARQGIYVQGRRNRGNSKAHPYVVGAPVATNQQGYPPLRTSKAIRYQGTGTLQRYQRYQGTSKPIHPLGI